MGKRNKPLRPNKLNELHAMAQELTANAISSSEMSLRAAALSGSNFTGDTLHSIELDYGYPEKLEFSHYWNMFRRFGIAKNVVELPVDTCWITNPTIEADAALMRDIEKLDKRIKLWTRLKGLDMRQRVGRYAGMFMRVRDNKKPSEPLDGTLNGESALMDMMPLYESQLTVVESDKDASSETFGQPVMLEYKQSAEGDRNDSTNDVIRIHASRVVFASEGSDNGWIYGIPALEAAYNSLMDLRKIIGGGAEGFYKNASQSVVFNLKDGASAIGYKDKLDDFNEQYDEFTRNRSRRAMWTPGMEAKSLDSNLISPEKFFDVALNDVAASSQIPATILIGKQTGNLASEEDKSQFLANMKSRRGNYCTEMTEGVVDWCIKYGILPAGDYDVVWDDLLARSDSEKLESADKMAGINEKQFKSHGDLAFSGDEIRIAAGYDEEPEEEIGGEEITEAELDELMSDGQED